MILHENSVKLISWYLWESFTFTGDSKSTNSVPSNNNSFSLGNELSREENAEDVITMFSNPSQTVTCMVAFHSRLKVLLLRGVGT